MEDVQICSLCKEQKNISRFAKRADFQHTRRRKDCMDCVNIRTQKLWAETRKEIFDFYGWECKCCGETVKEFMSLDHINDDGYLDKNPNGSKKSGKELYLLVKKQDFPNKYQTLCMNCNWGKHLKRGCPHQYNK